MHEYLNRCGVAVRRISPQLAEALLEIHIFMWNRKQGQRHGGHVGKQPEEYQIEQLKFEGAVPIDAAPTESFGVTGTLEDEHQTSSSDEINQLPVAIIQMFAVI